MKKKILFCCLTLLIIVVAHGLSTLLHEWTHGMVAYLSGYKSSPFDIYYGHDWIFLTGVNEAVDYKTILANNQAATVAWIAITPTLVGALLFCIMLYVINLTYIQKRKWVYYFCYFFALMNLGQVFDYIPIRTFSSQDDIANFLQAAHLSAWWVFVPGMAFVLWGIYRFFTYETQRAYRIIKIEKQGGREIFLLVALLILFGYFGAAGFLVPDQSSHSWSWMSWATVPILFNYLRKRGAK